MADFGTFDELRRSRRDYVAAARRNGFEEGLRSLLAELYPDNAHFIYELLQNAEDAQATVVEFELGQDELKVSHDGIRPFSLADIESITGIGKSTKKDDETKIGKFGVGFKAVFAYTTRPEIRSGEYSFAISDLFVPEIISGDAPAGRTTFTFPLDRVEKQAELARVEVERGLRELDEKTLLFLNNIREITYALPCGDIGFVKRIDLDELTIRIEASQGEGFVESTWLRLVGPASAKHEGPNPLTVAAAFRLEPKAVGRSRAADVSDRPTDGHLGIVPLDAGDVCIYFPAAKETSLLKFHIHAPFASTVARDSVRDTPENAQLVADIGGLIVSNLKRFRDRGLIDDGLLATLPNSDDNLRPIYGQIRSAIVTAFDDEDLTPVRGGGAYAPARSLVSSPPAFRTGLEPPDLRYLLDLGGTGLPAEPRWILDRDGRAGRFLKDLDTLTFGWEQLNDALGRLTELDEDEPDGEALTILRSWHAWLEAKDDERLLRLYELLGQDQDDDFWVSLDEFPIVRLKNGGRTRHVKGPTTYLPATRTDREPTRVPVELAYFDDDEADKRSNNLRGFYHSAGVRRWDERAKIEQQLAPYRAHDFPELRDDAPPASHFEDMRAFVQFGHTDSSWNARMLFSSVHFVLVVDDDGDLVWARPGEVYLDEPFRSTGLSALYSEAPGVYPLPGFYLEIEGIDQFLATLGARSGVAITTTSVFSNSELKSEWWARYRHSNHTINQDWKLENLESIAATADPALLETLWNTVANAKANLATAVYQANRSAGRHTFHSQLFQQLTTVPWVLGRDGEVHHPADITLDEIPSGWLRPAEDSLVQKLGFGFAAELEKAREEAKPQLAEQLGIELADAELLKEAKAAGVDVAAVIENALAVKRGQEAFPDGASGDPDRRAGVAAFDAAQAQRHQTEIRNRSVVVGQGALSEEAKAYLREQYTNAAGDMYCQACQQMLPFKLKGGEWYFQSTQFLSGRSRMHHQNALALCPLCAATYKHKKETSDAALLDLLSELEVEAGQGTVELPVLLNGVVVRLRLTGKHALDLQAAMAVAGEPRVTH
jgi:hypothetical protein